jgi:thiol-disulfide isomerase/thioredoxin
MFKIFTFIIAFLLISSTSFSQIVKIGDAVPDYQFEKVLNYSKPNINLREAKGKILIIEFWGTWCGPCIPALEHLNELQQKFKEDILVVGISDDTEERLNNFLLKRPVTIPLVADPMNKKDKFFKIPSVPMTFVTDKTGKVIAITHPNELTESKIKDLIANKKVELQTNMGKIFSENDPFGVDLKTIFSFIAKPMIDTIPTSAILLGSGVFEKRRLSTINMTTDFFIKKVFQKSDAKTIYLTDKKQFAFKPENRFSYDIIVSEEEKADFYKIAQQEISRRLKYKIYTEEKIVDVFVLKQIEGNNILKPSQSPYKIAFPSDYKRFRFSMQGSEMKIFVDELEEIFSIPIVDETGLKDKYDLTVDWAMGNKEERIKELQNIGLILEKTQRPVEMLVIADK